jgi:L-threonylcarbamoyladenylate synthase
MSGAPPPEVVSSRDTRAVSAAVTALRAGDLVGIPTETVYGIAVRPDEAGLERLVDAKRRPTEKGFQLIVDGLDQVDPHVLVSGPAARLAARFWPGPMTLALPLRPGRHLPDLLTGGRVTIGVRIPDHPVPRAIARAFGPIAVSSANLSGHAPALTVPQLLDAVGAALRLVIDDGPVRGAVPSTVVGIDEAGGMTIFRTGAISREQLEAALEEGL